MNKWIPTNLGAEPRKLAILGGLVVVLGVVYWMSRSPDSAPTPAPRPAAAPPAIASLPSPGPRPAQSSILQRRTIPGGNTGRSIDDFRPSVKLAEGTDVSQIDPSLRVDLLAKVRGADASGGVRSLFEFSQPPAPPPDKVKPIVPTAPKPVEEPKVVTVVEPPKPPAPPPPPPITLKYYGFAGKPQSGQRRAFFLDGEDIFVAGENELVRSRYKIVRIGVNSALVEDTTNKNQQTLPLVEEGG